MMSTLVGMPLWFAGLLTILRNAFSKGQIINRGIGALYSRPVLSRALSAIVAASLLHASKDADAQPESAPMLGLFFLVSTARVKSEFWQRERTAIYKFIDMIGPWAMLDVFLLAVLVGLVRLRQLATVLPGPGILAFTAVVVCTILATASFDSRLIWEHSEEKTP